jgi:hypothetical protein
MLDSSATNTEETTSKKKEILAAAVGVGTNAYRLAILVQTFIFPFFVYWFYKRHLDMFSTFTNSWHFLVSSMFGVVSVALYNYNLQIFKDKTSKSLPWYDPRMSLLIPAWYGGGHGWVGPGSLTDYHFYVQWLSCDFWWLLFVSPFWILYFVSKKTAEKTCKELVTTEDKNELREIIKKNL